jgi:predicted nucleic acid-binding protein
MAIYSKKVYLEPSIMCAFIDRAHPKHEQATAFFRFFAQEEYTLFTDSINLTDAYNTIYRDISPSLAKDFLRTMALSNINIIYPEEADMKAALKALVNYKSTELTYQKALVAVLANKRGISQIATFDYLHQLFDLQLFFLPM